MMQLVFRFLVGGVVVSVFATLGEVLKPKTFAGLFGAAPSVALATLGLRVATEERLYAAQEARSMIAGAAAFFLYCCFCIYLLIKNRWKATAAATSSLIVWFACAFALWFAFLR
jgi:uncharacterized membrane protein (GlpM family)